MGDPQTAEILLDTPEVVVESAAEDGTRSVKLVGTMFADGLNANAWGLTEKGAKAIASSLEGADLTAGHPDVVGYGFTRSIHDGPGKPIGTVASTGVQYFEGAMMAASGGGYSAEYEAEVTSPAYAEDFEQGLMIGGDYGVSIGITAADEDAICSIDGENFAECKHYRGEEVDGKIAGPLYDAGEADHLAVVYVPAWEEADAEVNANAAMLASSADEFFGQPFDEKHQQADAIADEHGDDAGDDRYQVMVTPDPDFTLQLP
ncbi:hypothetical protein HUG10_21505 (plasmid) [Halorarum halophilum]|uniref:Uncharacterized protein n=1 Tax=Halorarum halophilum TaxID=2743090 RepID=A0A7D5GPW5_9EURY|nr:hypothetical protein [Halobaculum halophilum]QLG30167.1 hypothetical protein HUG10_21505 [Halobaculum halophilum]